MDDHQEMTPAEIHAIKRHQGYLCVAWGLSVSFEEAREDWLRNRADAWRQARMRMMMEMQRAEMNRHKWILSEQEGRDVGRDAIFDWINNHAADWRDWFEEEFVETEV